MQVRNFKDYTKVRDIVQKRMKRAVQAGLMPPVHFPTVAEIKAGITTAQEAFKFVSEYFSGGSQVKTIRQTGLTPGIKYFREMKKPAPLSESQKKEKKRQQQRDYRRRRAVRQTAPSKAQANRYEGYLKALDTVSKTFRQRGIKLGIDLQSLTPAQAQAFVEYMDFRFSQGDFTQRYVIDEFIQDFSKLLNKGHSAKSIVSDFNKFLEDRAGLQQRADNMEGLTSDDSYLLWQEFMGD